MASGTSSMNRIFGAFQYPIHNFILNKYHHDASTSTSSMYCSMKSKLESVDGQNIAQTCLLLVLVQVRIWYYSQYIRHILYAVYNRYTVLPLIYIKYGIQRIWCEYHIRTEFDPYSQVTGRRDRWSVLLLVVTTSKIRVVKFEQAKKASQYKSH